MNRLTAGNVHAALGDIKGDACCSIKDTGAFEVESVSFANAGTTVDYVGALLKGDIGTVRGSTFESPASWLGSLKHDFAIHAWRQSLRSVVLIPCPINVGAGDTTSGWRAQVGERIADADRAGDCWRRGGDAGPVSADCRRNDRAATVDVLIR